MAGGETGGHVIPALAVARELKRRGHHPFFVGTERGVEARLVPAAGFSLELIRIGGLKRVGALQRLATLGQLTISTLRMVALMRGNIEVSRLVDERVGARPVYLILAMGADEVVRLMIG